MIVRTAAAGTTLRTNVAFRTAVGYSDAELAQVPLLDWIVAQDQPALRDLIERGAERCVVRHRVRDGSSMPLDMRVTRDGEHIVLLGRAAEQSNDITSKRHPAADDSSVLGTLDTIARIVEAQNPGYRCSILLVTDGRLVRGAGPSLPEAYNDAIDGYAIGPMIGSCGTAIYWNVPVIVEDIKADPLWAPFEKLAVAAGVGACWSHPFTSLGGRVLGALALYAPAPRAPTAEQLSRLSAAARMTGLAVERGRAEEALRAKRKRELELEGQLRQAAKMEALGVLAGGVAHDFNNVLATILANAEMAKEVLPPGADVGEMLEDIIVASRRAGGFCKQMLAYAGHGHMQRRTLQLDVLLPELNSLVRAAMSPKTTIDYTVTDKHIYVVGDENQLLQVIMNLVTNAAEAIGDQEGNIAVDLSVKRYTTADLTQLAPDANLTPGEYAHLTVSDNGSGMDGPTCARIFDPFFTTKFTGRGLGLAAVKGIVAGHGGTIYLDSKQGEGTTFTVILPIARDQQLGSKQAGRIQNTPVGKKILLVDDEDSLRTILGKRLKHAGYDVIEASDGQQAIDAFKKRPHLIDCVLLDLRMPKHGGEEVAKELLATRPDLPIVLMSGQAEQDALARLGTLSVTAVLQKPIVAADMLLALGKAMTSV